MPLRKRMYSLQGIHHRHPCAHSRCHNRRRNDPRRVHAAVLLPVSNHIHGNECRDEMLSIKNVHISLLATRPRFPFLSLSTASPGVDTPPFLSCPPAASQPLFWAVLSAGTYPGVPLSSSSFAVPPSLSALLCQVNDTSFYKNSSEPKIFCFLKPCIHLL